MPSAKADSSRRVVAYEPAFAQQRFHSRLRLAMVCGIVPLIPLLTALTGVMVTHSRQWVLGAIATVVIGHGVVGFGLFLICMEYAVQRDRLLPLPQFFRESRFALIALIANWPLFVAIVFVAWRWT